MIAKCDHRRGTSCGFHIKIKFSFGAMFSSCVMKEIHHTGENESRTERRNLPHMTFPKNLFHRYPSTDIRYFAELEFPFCMGILITIFISNYYGSITNNSFKQLV